MKTLGDRIKEARLARGRTQQELATYCSVSRAAVSQWESGTTVPGMENVGKAAAFLHVDSYELLTGKAPLNVQGDNNKAGGVALERVPVVGEAEAGVWREVETLESADPDYIEMPIDSRYSGLPRRAVRITGDSVSEIIGDGGYAIYVQISDLGRDPKSGEIVIADRIRHQGGLVERTVKEYRANGKQPELWPRSKNPRHKGPIKLSDRKSDDLEVRIVGIVTGKFELL
jgi:transcriptional regulator with XRE-family HTH domain